MSLAEARFLATVAGAPRPAEWPPYALPGAVAATLVEAERRGLCSEATVAYYTERMPSLLVEQQRNQDRARALLWRPIGAAPKLREALAGLFAALGAAGIDAGGFVGAASPEALLATRPTVAAVYAHCLFGSGAPLVGAYPEQRVVYDRELDHDDPDRVLDRRLSANLLHEICHGPPSAHAARATPWMLAEAAALTLGAAARPAHIFPDEPGEAVAGVTLFVCLGSALARRWGRAGLFGLLAGRSLADVAGPTVAAALDAAAWQDWAARLEPPFARDALAAMAWLKLAELAPRNLDDDLLARAARTPWRELRWWQEEVFAVEELEEALAALGVVQVLAPGYETHPSPLPGARLHIDVEACVITAERRPDGVFGEPAWWLLPPPLGRRLWERGARRLRLEGVVRGAPIAAALMDLAGGTAPLAAEQVWTFSA